MSLLYDSDNPDSIPDGVQAAGYCDGYAAVAWAARGWSRFPNARRIQVFAANDCGDSFDCESGDIAPTEVPNCVLKAHARGIAVPWVYVNRANGYAAEQAMLTAGIGIDQVALWIATLDGTEVVTHWNNGVAVYYHVAAVQYANSTISGGHYDLSIMEDNMLDRSDPVVKDLLSYGQREVYALGITFAVDPTGADPDYGYKHPELARSTVLEAMQKELKDIKAALPGGTPEPAEPTKVVLHVPAQDIHGEVS